MISPVRVAFDYDVTRPADHAQLASGRTVHAAVDPTGRPCRLPVGIREVLT